ncbi:MAG: YfaZ family protein [Gammaproteobacteria bacterium]|nr:YfaZ family protein [Gammaproteobacteria bacterium]
MRKVLLGFALAMLSMGAQATGLELALSNKTANLALLINPYQFKMGGGSELALGGFINEDGDNLAHATLMARGYRQTVRSQYNLGAGMKLVAGDLDVDTQGISDSESVGALALGFQMGVLLNPSRLNPVELTFEGFLAPKITSFADAESFSELGARLQVEVIPQAKAYVGYRRMKFDTNDYDNVNLDQSIHLGIKLTF